MKFMPDESITRESIAAKLKILPSDIADWRIYKRGIDARKKSNVHYVCTIDAELKNEDKFLESGRASKFETAEYKFPEHKPLLKRPVIVGFGPAGMFAALVLAENGHRPIVLERGESVEERGKRVRDFWEKGIFNPVSNVQFGEGGAGTFSDGKLTTGIKNIRCRRVLEYFVKFGAPEDILYNSKPHIGTDILCKIVKNIREYIISLGGDVRFCSRADSFVIENSHICAVAANGEEISADNVILAIGHSARDTMAELYRLGVGMYQKPFSVGARIEHDRLLIDKAQYGDFAPLLPAADYKLSAHIGESGRGVYTFCMCPGGVVVAAASEEGGVVTNGMSNRKRDGINSNSALLVSVNPSDLGSEHPLAGIEFQRRIEQKAYEFGGNNYLAPAQLVGDFMRKIPSVRGAGTRPTYMPGVAWGSIDDVLPGFVCDSMRAALGVFDRKIHGFAGAEAVLTAPETRSSSPVRIVRDSESFQSPVGGLYPCGEGAGYAGGIMSAAVDGIVCAEKLVMNED